MTSGGVSLGDRPCRRRRSPRSRAPSRSRSALPAGASERWRRGNRKRAQLPRLYVTAAHDGMLSNITCTVPASMSVNAGADPR